MLFLDTNILSELMREKPAQHVVDWLNEQARTAIWTSAVTQFELRYGIHTLPSGRRGLALQAALHRLPAETIAGRILPFDAAAAKATARLMGERSRGGRTGERRDAMIAGIAMSTRATLVTRNTRHFADLAVPVIDPWVT